MNLLQSVYFFTGALDELFLKAKLIIAVAYFERFNI